jgi:hypothetical protein
LKSWCVGRMIVLMLRIMCRHWVLGVEGVGWGWKEGGGM